MSRTALAAALLGAALSVVPAVPASASTAEYGKTAARDRVLKPSCHDYRYRFVIKAPTNDWTLETYLIGPRGRRLASGVFSSESEDRRDHGVFRICRSNTRPGKFTIKAKLNWYNGSEDHQVWFKPSYFRLHRA
ncbi:hypothetical protein H5V45_21430 [Nocardioides sp. KIGAM211]|uniref:Secreted protein n=1 Tax=Nocardioides luti TaxID=2761101 RepID=A0A7X0VE04_9ACTN|nr:hypothetical protein [Nocardioides luti]MBB6629893.1 hypothetical protein [Nocardioides luti]